MIGFIPFGHGPRRCNGRKLAMTTLHCLIARFVMTSQCAFSKPIDDKYDEDETWLYGTTGFTGTVVCSIVLCICNMRTLYHLSTLCICTCIVSNVYNTLNY